VASGVDVVLGHPFHTSGSKAVEEFLGAGARARLGGGFETIAGPLDAAKWILERIDAKREKLGINQKAERKLFDMKDRRAAHV
jgi:anaerobic carbon-monoxide dehydrogenase catalytic subunit